MSDAAETIISQIKALPLAEQRELARQLQVLVEAPRPPRRPIKGWLDDDDPFFGVMARIEEERHRTPGRPAPTFD